MEGGKSKSMGAECFPGLRRREEQKAFYVTDRRTGAQVSIKDWGQRGAVQGLRSYGKRKLVGGGRTYWFIEAGKERGRTESYVQNVLQNCV